MTGAPRRCRGCIADSLRKVLWQLHRGRGLVAADIVIMAMADLLKPADPLCECGQRIRDAWFRLAGRKP